MNLRKLPPVCLFIAIIQILTGRLRFSKNYFDNTLKMEDGSEFTIFRHITTHPVNRSTMECVFIVSFKFAHLSNRVNKLTSIMPMLMIAGFPGFVAKVYALNANNGYWQGMYQWKSLGQLEDYKKSFVFRMMNKRAITDSINEIEMSNQKLSDFIDNHKIEN